MPKIRKQTYTMSMFMEYIKDRDIRDDADVQRASGQWSSEQKNELIMTVLTDGYIPPVFIGEDANRQKWLLDGLQRSSSLKLYRHGNYRISSAVRNSIITYRAKTKDENGDIVWEDAVFDIKNKTYEELPDELKKQFDSFQIDAIVFEECTMEKMSELIQVYNNHAPMNTTQKAFTYVSNFARTVRKILESRFFVDCSNYTEKEKIKGVTERVVLETVMGMFHLDDWKKQAKQLGVYLNEHSSKEEFQRLSDNLRRLEQVITEETKELFNSKNSFLFLTLFDRFTKLGADDHQFIEFLEEFKINLRWKKIGGILFDEIDKGKGTKDKAVVISKLTMLENMMWSFLRKKAKKTKTALPLDYKVTAKDIFKEYVDAEVEDEDIELFEMVADDVSEAMEGVHSVWLSKENRASFVALTGYAMKEETEDELKSWFPDYERRKHGCDSSDQKRNYLHMKLDFERYLKNKRSKQNGCPLVK